MPNKCVPGLYFKFKNVKQVIFGREITITLYFIKGNRIRQITHLSVYIMI